MAVVRPEEILINRQSGTHERASAHQEAAELWRNHRDRIDIVLVDVSGAEGLALAQMFELDCPGKPIVVIMADDRAWPYPVLRKPFDLDDVSAEMLRILEHQKSQS